MALSKGFASKLKLGVNIATLAGSVGLMFVPGGQVGGMAGIARSVASLGAGFVIDKAGDSINKTIDKNTEEEHKSSKQVNSRGRDTSSTIAKSSQDLADVNKQSDLELSNMFSDLGLDELTK